MLCEAYYGHALEDSVRRIQVVMNCESIVSKSLPALARFGNGNGTMRTNIAGSAIGSGRLRLLQHVRQFGC
jgi:hypothetical protein